MYNEIYTTADVNFPGLM